MRNHPAIILVLIILLLILIGTAFAWMLSDQKQKLAQEEAAAVAAVQEQVPAAAEALSEAVRGADAAMVRDLAAEHVYAHRGTSGEPLEHSFRAYDQAVADGARYLEQDIVISKEGTLYISHDLSASRMTGVNKAFSSMTDAEIDRLRTHAGEKPLRLSEVFDRYGTSVSYVVELKSADQATINAFTSLVNQYGFADRIIVQCFYLDTLRILEEIYPDMPKLYLVEYSPRLEAGYEADYVDIISAFLPMMTEENVKRAHRIGKQFSAWPMTTESEIRRAIDLGVDSYFTDDVKLAISLEEEYGFEKRYR